MPGAYPEGTSQELHALGMWLFGLRRVNLLQGQNGQTNDPHCAPPLLVQML